MCVQQCLRSTLNMFDFSNDIDGDLRNMHLIYNCKLFPTCISIKDRCNGCPFSYWHHEQTEAGGQHCIHKTYVVKNFISDNKQELLNGI